MPHHVRVGAVFAAAMLIGTSQANRAEPSPPAGGVTVVPKTTQADVMPAPAADRLPSFVTLSLSQGYESDPWRMQDRWPYRSPILDALMPRTAMQAEKPAALSLPPSYGARRDACAAELGMKGKFAAVVLERSLYGERIVIDVNGDAPRHPASLAKVMTLLLAFQAIEEGRITLEDTVIFSPHARAASPVNLESEFARTGRASLTLDEALKAIGTKSANDAARAVAEHIAGNEAAFAVQMTAMAAEIGMQKTVYANASGLPDERQVTTARDMLLLMRYVQQRYPAYIPYLSAREFTIAKSERVLAAERKRAARRGRNHTAPDAFVRVAGHFSLMGQRFANGYKVEWGKTGFVGASGFNRSMEASRADGAILSAAVFGGVNAASADNCLKTMVSRL